MLQQQLRPRPQLQQAKEFVGSMVPAVLRALPSKARQQHQQQQQQAKEQQEVIQLMQGSSGSWQLTSHAL
jgi:hypothetical protein